MYVIKVFKDLQAPLSLRFCYCQSIVICLMHFIYYIYSIFYDHISKQIIFTIDGS